MDLSLARDRTLWQTGLSSLGWATGGKEGKLYLDLSLALGQSGLSSVGRLSSLGGKKKTKKQQLWIKKLGSVVQWIIDTDQNGDQ